jgi:hypothetical protein
VYVASTFEEGEDSYKYEKLEGDSWAKRAMVQAKMATFVK